MDWSIHHLILGAAFMLAFALGLLGAATHFCTLGAVSDWVNFGSTARLRAWVLAMGVALSGTTALQAAGLIELSVTFPPYRMGVFNPLRHLLGGLLFGIGMTLAGGCGNKTLLRVGAGNLKSLVVLVVTGASAYLLIYRGGYEALFGGLSPLAIDLAGERVGSQALGDLLAAPLGVAGLPLNLFLGMGIAIVLVLWALSSRQMWRDNANLAGGLGYGAIVTAGWALTASSLGAQWKEWAAFADPLPSRVEAQSFSFVSPMADAVRWLSSPTDASLINFGLVSLCGVVVGALVHAASNANFRIEWFRDPADAVRHVSGAVLMAAGATLAMGCTIGQGITGLSTLAAGAFLSLVSIVMGCIVTLRAMQRGLEGH